MSLSRI